MKSPRQPLAALLVLAALSGCAKKQLSDSACLSSVSQNLSTNASASGHASVFLPDPIARSGSSTLSPTSLQLDSYRTTVTLANLTGKGILEGKYVNVRNGLSCGDSSYNAFDASNEFVYSHSDPRFQEAMAYYFGDQYRATLDSANVLQPAASVKIVAHCMRQDNAYFSRSGTTQQNVIEKVCLGDSTATPGASYADDAIVTVHELQHATTVDTYDPDPMVSLSGFFYDEAGALNEAISDFMGLIYTAPMVASAAPSMDMRIFSRWALGTFIPHRSGIRGAHKCPQYDSTFPNCSNFDTAPFSAANNTLSYIYPDGLGWPFADNFSGPGKLQNAFLNYSAQEEIHNAGVLMVGALWDVYEAILANHGGDAIAAEAILDKLVMATIGNLPKPNWGQQQISPVTFRVFASTMQSRSATVLNAADQAAAAQALTKRGLLGGSPVTDGWVATGPGTTEPGIQVVDNPSTLKGWIYEMRSMGMPADPTVVTQGISTGLNGLLDPGEAALIRFDIQNISAVTAGGVLVTVTAPPEVTILDDHFNNGYLGPSQAQIYYGKINGTGIVSALNGDATYGVPTSNSYFQTNPFTAKKWFTGLWIKVSSTAAHGQQVSFHVVAKPSNGPAAAADFHAVIH